MKKNESRKDYSGKQVSLFRNSFFERITKTNPLVAISSYVVISIGMIVWAGIYMEISPGAYLLFPAGWIIFTLIEYLAHRYAYHSGEYRVEGHWQYKVHGYHHDFPKDEERLVMPIWLAFILLGLFFGVFYMFLGKYAFFFFPGFLFGYGYYLLIHYLVHAYKPPKGYFRFLWRHHHLHHSKFENSAFGVSTRLWDMVFHTMPKHARMSKSH